MENLKPKQYTYRYPHPAVTTDCVIFTFHEDKLKVLLIRRGIEPFRGEWALPGGFMRIDESAEECAHRELREETGVTGCPIRQFHTFSAPGRDPRERVVSIAFYALVKWQRAQGADDAEYAGWIPMNNLPPLAFDHAEIIKKAMEAIRRDLFFEPVGFELLEDQFTMPQLQHVYEEILGKSFDRRNFAKKMKHTGIIESIDEKNIPQVSRPKFNRRYSTMSNEYIPLEAVAEPENIFSVIDNANKQEAPKKRRGRFGNLFRLNREKYKEIKDNDSMEW